MAKPAIVKKTVRDPFSRDGLTMTPSMDKMSLQTQMAVGVALWEHGHGDWDGLTTMPLHTGWPVGVFFIFSCGQLDGRRSFYVNTALNSVGYLCGARDEFVWKPHAPPEDVFASVFFFFCGLGVSTSVHTESPRA